MASGTKVVYWSGAKRWHPGKIDGYVVELQGGKIVKATPIDEMPKGMTEIRVAKNVLEDLPKKRGVWAHQWAQEEEVVDAAGNG